MTQSYTALGHRAGLMVPAPPYSAYMMPDP